MITKSPENYSPAGNPLIFELSGEGIVPLTISGNDITYNLSTEAFDGKAVIDVASYVRMMFKKTTPLLEALTYKGSNIVAQEMDNYVNVNVNDGDVNRIFLRGMYLAGELKRFTKAEYKLLTRFKKIIRYEGLEYIVSVNTNYSSLCISIDGEYIKYGSGLEISNINENAPVLSINLSEITESVEEAKNNITLSDDIIEGNIISENGDILIDSNGNEILAEGGEGFATVINRYPIEVREIPANPLYVRWINRYGGYDYWMFSCRHNDAYSLDNIEMAGVYNGDINSVGKRVEAFGKQYSRQVTALAGALDANEYECIRDIMFSERIEIFKGLSNEAETQGWEEVTIEPFTASKYSDTPRNDIEITFNIPLL